MPQRLVGLEELSKVLTGLQYLLSRGKWPVTKERKEKIKTRVLLAAALVGVLVYAWMTSWVLEPRLTLPPSVFANSAWKVDGKAVDFIAIQSRFPQESEAIAAALSTIENGISALGALPQPLTLVINFDEPFRYFASDVRLELGSKVAMTEGQLEKAVIKAWLRQRAAGTITSSLLRMDVVSDLLLAMLSGKMDLALPGEDRHLEPGEIGNWLGFAMAFSASCDAPWRALELRDLCGKSASINPQSFRPLLDSMIWSVYQSVPEFSRATFMNAWITTLQAPNNRVPHGVSLTLAEEKKWLTEELEDMLPIAQISVARETIKLALNQAIHKARLSDDDSLLVDYVFHSEQDLQSRIFDSAGNKKNAVTAIMTEEGLKLVRGQIEIWNSEISSVQTRVLVWESCRAPHIDEVLDEKLKNERFLFVQNCDAKTPALYGSLIDGGIESFAYSNQSAPFLLLRREALRLAMSRAALNPMINLTDLMTKGSARSLELLGLERASLRHDIQAYRVLGAIEAIEWFRSEPAMPPTHSTLQGLINLGTGS
jgi:hypothetical protein